MYHLFYKRVLVGLNRVEVVGEFTAEVESVREMEDINGWCNKLTTEENINKS